MKLSCFLCQSSLLIILIGIVCSHVAAQCDVDVATSIFFSKGEPVNGYGLTLETVAEHTTGDLAGLTTYRLYMQTAHPTDRIIAAVGDDEFPLSLMTETAFYQNPFGNNSPEGLSPAWISLFPDLAYDSWVTIGLEGPSSSSDEEESVTMLFASEWESVFASGQGFVVESENGSGWTVVPWTATNTLAGPEQRVLLAQLTTHGHLSGSMRVQVFPESDNKNDLWLDVTFDTNVVCGCTDQSAVNHNPNANANDGSCLFEPCSDEYACNFGESTPPFQGCDYPEPGYDCGGNCFLDQNNDGVCDPYQPDQCHTSQADVEGCPGDFKLSGYVDINDLLVFNTLWGDVCSEPGCDGDFTGDGEVDVNDLLDFFQLWGNECPWVWVPGDPCNACTDPEACNFSPNATNDDGSCAYPEDGYDCDGNCLADDNDNGICDALEIEGCTDSSACNYDASATYGDNNVLCDYSSCFVFGCTSPFACNFNPNAVYNTGSCDFLSCAGCTLPSACNYDPTATLNNGSCDFISCRGCTNPEASNYDPDALIDDGSCEILGCTNSGACNFDINATVNDGSCDFLSCLPSGCLLTAACNYDPSALVASGECIFPEDGYDCDGNCLNDTDGDGVCNPFEVPGCDDPDAFNYDPSATENNGSCVAVSLGCLDATACNYVSSANTEDGSCDYDSCVGCTQFFACNYNPDATVSSGDCVFAEFGYDCDGECLIDSDGDGVCNQFEVNGCTDPYAYNFEQEATEDDGSCILCAPLSSACGPGTYWDDVAEACLPSLSADLNLDGCVGMGDLLELLSAFGACIDD